MQSISKRFTTNLSGLLMPCLMLPSPCMATVRDEFIVQTASPKVHVERRLGQSCHCGHYVTCDLRGHEPCICRVLRCMYGHPLVLPVSYINCLMSQVYESITESGLCGQCLEIRAISVVRKPSRCTFPFPVMGLYRRPGVGIIT